MLLTPEEQKLNREKFDLVCSECGDLYDEKNVRYNNAFALNFRSHSKQIALQIAAGRLSEKTARAEYVASNPDDFGDESIVDSLMDLINYSVIVLTELKR